MPAAAEKAEHYRRRQMCFTVHRNQSPVIEV